MLEMLEKMVLEGFLKDANLKMLIVDDDIESLLEKLRNDTSEGELVGKWIGRA
jgi:predicted Rossmann-fold nucleotide-binding protein